MERINKEYSKPRMVKEKFVPQEFVAACGAVSQITVPTGMSSDFWKVDCWNKADQVHKSTTNGTYQINEQVSTVHKLTSTQITEILKNGLSMSGYHIHEAWGASDNSASVHTGEDSNGSVYAMPPFIAHGALIHYQNQVGGWFFLSDTYISDDINDYMSIIKNNS